MQAAYFLSDYDHIGRPLDDVIIHGLMEAGFGEIHLFAPDGPVRDEAYSDLVKVRPVEYRSRWLRQTLLKNQWREFALFLGACNLPMAFAGAIAFRARRPIVTICDEIFTGRLSPAGKHWEILAKLAMRRSTSTVITDLVRCDLQRSYAGLTADHQFVETPCCYASHYSGATKTEIRQRLAIPYDAFVITLAGGARDYSGVPELVELMGKRLPDLHFLVQTAGTPGQSLDAFFSLCQSAFPLHYFPERLSFMDALEITNAGDIGFVVYRQMAPQFQNMGVSSNKLCCHLFLGQPVIALKQPSFQFIESYQCGVLIESAAEIVEALERLRNNYDVFSQNALRCVQEYIQPEQRVQTLAKHFSELTRAV